MWSKIHPASIIIRIIQYSTCTVQNQYIAVPTGSISHSPFGGRKVFMYQSCIGTGSKKTCVLCIVMQSKKTKHLKKTSAQKNCFFFIIYNLKAEKCFLILWSAYSCYIQVVKHYILYVNCIFIDSETNYLALSFTALSFLASRIFNT